jgi:hypothetical protein
MRSISCVMEGGVGESDRAKVGSLSEQLLASGEKSAVGASLGEAILCLTGVFGISTNEKFGGGDTGKRDGGEGDGGEGDRRRAALLDLFTGVRNMVRFTEAIGVFKFQRWREFLMYSQDRPIVEYIGKER